MEFKNLTYNIVISSENVKKEKKISTQITYFHTLPDFEGFCTTYLSTIQILFIATKKSMLFTHDPRPSENVISEDHSVTMHRYITLVTKIRLALIRKLQNFQMVHFFVNLEPRQDFLPHLDNKVHWYLCVKTQFLTCSQRHLSLTVNSPQDL